MERGDTVDLTEWAVFPRLFMYILHDDFEKEHWTNLRLFVKFRFFEHCGQYGGEGGGGFRWLCITKIPYDTQGTGHCPVPCVRFHSEESFLLAVVEEALAGLAAQVAGAPNAHGAPFVSGPLPLREYPLGQ